MTQFAVVNLARRTGDRFRDIDEPLRERVLDWLGAARRGRARAQARPRRRAARRRGADRVFGEALPKGLRLR